MPLYFLRRLLLVRLLPFPSAALPVFVEYFVALFFDQLAEDVTFEMVDVLSLGTIFQTISILSANKIVKEQMIQSSLYFNGKHKDSIKLLAFSETKTPNLSPVP